MTDPSPTPSKTGAPKFTLAHAALALAAASLLCSAAVIKSLHDARTPVFVTVSLKTLLERHIEHLRNENLSPAERERQSDAYVAALEDVIARVSEEHDVIVLVSEAVISAGVADLTPEVAALADEMSARGKRSEARP